MHAGRLQISESSCASNRSIFPRSVYGFGGFPEPYAHPVTPRPGINTSSFARLSLFNPHLRPSGAAGHAGSSPTPLTPIPSLASNSLQPLPAPARSAEAFSPSVTSVNVMHARSLPGAFQASSGCRPLPLFAHRLKPRAYADAVDRALVAGASPFDLVSSYESERAVAKISASARSAWNVYSEMCAQWCWPVLPLTVQGLVGFMIGYVRLRSNSSANLPSEMSHLRAFAKSQRPPIPWPDFLLESGDTLTAHIRRIQEDFGRPRSAPPPSLCTRRVFAWLSPTSTA
jgi:hypothetical protein